MASISATTAAVIAAVSVAASTSMAAYSAVAAGEAQKESADYNAEMQRRAAHDSLVRGEMAASERRQKVKQLISSQVAGFAGSGLNANVGSSLDILTETAGFGELDALRMINNAQRQASGLTAQANLTEWNGNMAAQAGMLNATGTVLGGVGKMASIGYDSAKGASPDPGAATTTTTK